MPPDTERPAALKLVGAGRTYQVGKVEVPALRGVDLEVKRGEFVAIVGPSGSGKTTLLNLAGLLDHSDTGEVWLDGEATSGLGEVQRAKLRRRKIGFIFQSFNLMPHLTAEENVGLPLRYADRADPRITPGALLERVGLGPRRHHKPDELSGGEQQRVAIARALILNPPMILADEPTGELDSETAAGVHTVLERLRAAGKAVIVVTHNPELASIARRVVRMRDGKIEDDVDSASVGRRASDRPVRRSSGRGTKRTQQANRRPSEI